MEEAASTNTTQKAVLPDAKNGAASMLVAKVADLMATYLDAGQLFNNPPLFTNLCFSLAKGIDHAIANNEVPLRSRDLPPLLRQVYGSPADVSVPVGLMMLTMSIQSACKLEWFPNQDTDDLLIIVKEAMKTFSDPEHIRIEPAHAFPWVSKVMSRFFPSMKIDQMLFSLELQPGFRFCVASFPIIRGTVSPKQNKIRLFVARLDNLETSSCIITPPEANFLLNGQEVEGRTTLSMDKGPQLPTDVTAMLKYGVNCLQAIGHFNGIHKRNVHSVCNFLLVIAVTSSTQCSNSLELQDYVEPSALTDSAQTPDIPLTISLNCPISKSRIKSPVKGKLCKHPQCFDYHNFLDINSRRPSWQCPHCEQPVCNSDIRIDQNVVKVLREADEKVVNVVMSTNGSWKEPEDHFAQTYGDSQVSHQGQHQNHYSLSRKIAAARSTPMHNPNQTGSAAGNSVPNQNISSNLLGSVFSSKASVNSDCHDNSGQFVHKISPLRSQDSGADSCSTSLPFKQQNQHYLSLSNLNTFQASCNTRKVANGSVHVSMQPDGRDGTIQNTSTVVYQPLPLARGSPFQLTTSRTISKLNPIVPDVPRRYTNQELQHVKMVNVASGELEDWRPTRRMRGSLHNEAYAAAFHQFMIQQTQTAQALQPPLSYATSTHGPFSNAVATINVSESESHQRPGESTNLSGF